MGILNVTPDSFYPQSCYYPLESAISRGHEIYTQGADILDIGGESTRPGSDSVDEQEELKRVIPVIKVLAKNLPIPISIDTTKPEVAAAAIEAGATLINDVNGFRDPAMRKVAAESGAELCLMHMQGTPKTMQQNPSYPEGVLFHLHDFFAQQIDLLMDAGVSKDKIIIDPGVGFGKTIADNLEIIDNLHKLKEMGFPLLLGVSRKSFLRKILNTSLPEMLAATLTVNMLGILQGVDIIRVHDIPEHRDMVAILTRINPKGAI